MEFIQIKNFNINTITAVLKIFILKHFNLSKGFIFHLITGNGRDEAKLKYSKMSEKQILNVGNYYFKKWDLAQYSNKKIPISCYTNLNDKYIKNS